MTNTINIGDIIVVKTVIVIVSIAVIIAIIRTVILNAFAPMYRKNFDMRMAEPTGFLEFFLSRNPGIDHEEFSCEASSGDTT